MKTRDQILTAELLRCRELFQDYGDLHMAKTPPQRAKAQTNYAAVERINAALMAKEQTPETVEELLRSWGEVPETESPPTDPLQAQLAEVASQISDAPDDASILVGMSVGTLRRLAGVDAG